jgi:DNA-binding response OmpR family regulator
VSAIASRVLILDDDPVYGQQLSDYLRMEGFSVDVVLKPEHFPDHLARFEPDLILLDQRLGSVRGTEVLLSLRQRSSVPCIVVTGASNPLDRIVNLEIGADDEIEKSAAPRELLARIRAVLRRGGGGAIAPRAPMFAPGADASMAGWTLSARQRDLLCPDGTGCALTSSEFETLKMLWDSRGVPVSRSRISEYVFKRPYRVGDRAVDTVVMKLRTKLATAGQPNAISSVRLTGYVFTGFEEESVG